MDLGNLHYAPRSRKNRKRLGIGEGSGHGGTSTKGHKGQLSRAGTKTNPWFEGGQMPLQRRLPKRGFTNIFRIEYQTVNVKSLQRLQNVNEVTPAVLYQNGLIGKKNQLVKILGGGDLQKALTVHAHAFSKSALEKIEKAGGKTAVLAAAK
ncbi:MAG: 50S ribosomal protein L15 [candidate division KSB1 bacterium]|nr:50S ribosomal protein L15 [candidate division KSB1 bacterium]MDZ7366082.1 50S ribosomal protein L15 [candidate division KSB1 bacterium]MDZ7404276.1 50S ribosomal protein L15 [candidate division KSB1 bacterium]